MATSTNITNEIEKVINDRYMTKAEKDECLLKMGFRKQDLNIIWFTHRKRGYRPTFVVGDLTFGVEIECYHANRFALQNALAERGLTGVQTGYHHHEIRTEYRLATDCSISGSDPCECVSPILKGNTGERSLKAACEALASVGAQVNRSCGLHVHFGAAKLTDKHYVRIFKNYQMCEAVIDSFMPESRRGSANTYCKSIRGVSFANCTTKASVKMAMHHDRYYKVNAMSYDSHGTIEFRHHSGSTNYTKIIMWVEFLRELIDYSHDHEITTQPTCVDDLPFVSATVKAYLKNRINEVA